MRPPALVSLLLVAATAALSGCATSSGADRNLEAISHEEALAAHPLSPVERALIEDAADRRLDSMDLIDAALVASGVADEEARRAARARLEPGLARALAEVAGLSDPEARGRALLAALHRHLLGTYREEASTLIDVIEHQRFNCVSATLLYNALAERADLLVKAVILPSHVFSVLFTGRGPIEVETTTPQGFAPKRGTRTYVQFLLERGLAQGRGLLGGPGDQAGQAEPAAEIDSVTLVSLIWSNRGLDLFRDGDPVEAHAMFRRAHLLAEGARSLQLRAHVAAMVNNLALEAVERGELRRAIQFIDLGWEDAPSSSREVLAHNRAYCIQELASRAADRGEHAKAVSIYAEGLARDPGNAQLHHNRAVTYNDWAQALIGAGDSERGVELLRRGIQLEPRAGFLRGNLVAVVHNQAVVALRRDDCGAALRHLGDYEALGSPLSDLSSIREECARRGVLEADASTQPRVEEIPETPRPARLGLCP